MRTRKTAMPSRRSPLQAKCPTSTHRAATLRQAYAPICPIPVDTMPPTQAQATDDGRRAANEAARREELNHILRSVAQGNAPSFAELYRRTSAKLFGICLTMLRDQGEAEEVLQDVYVTIWRQARAFDPSLASPITWLCAIARNRSIDNLRRRQPTVGDDDVAERLADERPSPAALAELSQERRRLELCLDALPSTQRKAVREAFFSGASHSELAARLDVPLGTVKSWIRRSLLQLKACLER